jgi:hypothetical protein
MSAVCLWTFGVSCCNLLSRFEEEDHAEVLDGVS